MKKVISYLITIMMILTMMPYVAFADNVSDQAVGENKTSEGVITSDVVINPIYEDIIVDEDLEPLNSFSNDSIKPNTSSDDEDEIIYENGIEFAAESLREQMKDRANEAVVYLMIRNSDVKDVEEACHELFNIAIEHTGVPTEGDYLGFVWQGMNCQMEYFFVGSTAFATYRYKISYYTNASQENKVDVAVNNLKNDLNVSSKSDYEKLKAIYDYMTSNIKYDYENLNDDSYKLKHTAYAALIDKTAVCQGYAVLFYRLALECGVDARVITGKSNNENHGWNIVKLDGKYYYVDATWDAGNSDYNYFLKGSDDFDGHFSDSKYNEASFTSKYPIDKANYELTVVESGSCGENLTWTLDDHGLLSISGSGEMDNYTMEGYEYIVAPPWASYRHQIKSVLIKEGVTSVGDYAFRDYTQLTSISMPDGLIRVGKFAFYGSQHIVDTASNIILPDSVCQVGSHAFPRTIYSVSILNKDCSFEDESFFGINIICGLKESTAEAYAAKYGCEFYAITACTVKDHDYEAVVTAPTCTEKGYTTYTCKRDPKHTYTDKFVNAIGHKYSPYKTIDKAKFGKNGEQTATCTVCSAKGTKPIAAPKTIKLSYAEYTYNGKIKKPTVKAVYDSEGNKISSANYKVSYASGRKNVGKYKVTVTFNKNSADYEGKIDTTFKINPKGTTISSLAKVKKGFTVKWKKQTGKMAKTRITGYQYRYSTSSKMTNATIKTVKGYGKTSAKKTGLKAKKTYYVQVRTYKTVKGVKYYSPWSKYKKVKTK